MGSVGRGEEGRERRGEGGKGVGRADTAGQRAIRLRVAGDVGAGALAGEVVPANCPSAGNGGGE